MRRTRVIIIVTGISVIICTQIVFTVLLSTPDGIRLRSPEGNVILDRSFIAAGDVWIRTGISSLQVVAARAEGDNTSQFSFTGTRDAVKYRGKTLQYLSSWSARIELPSDGQWMLHAVATGTNGNVISSGVRRIVVRRGAPVREFRSWTPEHIMPICVIALVAVGLGFIVKSGKEHAIGEVGVTSRYVPVGLCITIVMWVNELVYQAYWFKVGGWSVASALMLQMCGLSILFLPVMLLSERQRTRQFLFDILYFWGIGGALQALIAPDIGANGFPAFKYFSFFVSHGLIITSAVVMAIAGRVSITPRSLLRVFVFSNIFLIPVYGIDRALSLIPPYDVANYFVLGYPPPTGSVVDLFSDIFGPSPRYVIGLELMGIVVFGLLYLPWPIARLLAAHARPKKTPRIS